MDWESILKLVAVVAGLGATAVALAKHFSNQQKAVSQLRAELKELKTQTKVLRQPLAQGGPPGTANVYQQLLAASTEAQEALAADLHSISVPVPPADPTHLRIILSTDPESEKVVGREFPLTKGIAGWVFQRQQPSFKNPADTNPHHFALVDKAAGTQTGAGAILTLPILSGQKARGVIQYMKTKGGRFDESDVQIATRLLPSIARLLVELQESSTADIPVVAYGDTRPMTILFTDITAFSAVTATLRLQDSVGILNEYYSRALQFAINKGGKLEEYLGDGLYVSFTHSVSSQAARAAVAAALEMQAEYYRMLNGWREYQHPVSDLNNHRIGIATGVVYSGLVGHPQERRNKLIGTAVDLASHLCEDLKAVQGGIALCPRTKELLGDEWTEFSQRRLNHGDAWIVNASPAG